MMVTNQYGVEVNFDVAMNLMDDSIRESVHDNLAPCTEQEFFNCYCAIHNDIFGEEFELDKENGVY